MIIEVIAALIGSVYILGLIATTIYEYRENQKPGALPQTLGGNSTTNWAVDRLMLDGHTRASAQRQVLGVVTDKEPTDMLKPKQPKP